MKERKLVPKRRFLDYQDLWVAYNWGETVDISTNMVDPRKEKYADLLHVGPGNIKSFSGEISDNVKKVKEENLISGKFLFHPGDIIYGKINPQLGKYAFAEVKGLASADAYILNTKNGVSQDFFFTILQSKEFFKYSVSVSSRTGMPKINRNELNQYQYYAPLLEEQQKIGNFFKHLDQMISLEQRKLEKTKALKSAYLAEMFPAEGERVPKRRFPGFNEAWRSTKISDIFTVTRGNVLSVSNVNKKRDSIMQYPVYSSQTLNNGLMGYYSDYLFDTAITWTTDGANAGTVNYREGKFYSTNVNGVLISDKGYANKAVAEGLNLVAWKHVSKVGNPKLMNNIMGNIVIQLPTSIDELEKMSTFFNQLDQTITNQKQKLNKLKAIKQAYLEEMFV